MKGVIGFMVGMTTGMLVCIYSPKLRRDVINMGCSLANKIDEVKDEIIQKATSKKQDQSMGKQKKPNNSKKDYKNEEE